MAHRIFTGPFEALETMLVAEIGRRQSRDRLAPVPILVGSNLLAAHLKRRVALEAGTAANIRFLTFLDLAGTIARGAGSRGRKPLLPALGPRTLLEDLIEERLPEVFNPVAAFRGFRASLLETFRDLRDAGIPPVELERAIGRLGPIPADRAAGLAGLAELYGRFRGGIARFRDVDDDFRRAIEHANTAPRLLGSAALLVYGVYDTTGRQAELLEGLARSLDMVCFVPYLDERISSFARPFLDARAGQLQVPAERLEPDAGKSGLRRLAARLFPPPGGEFSDPGPLPADGSFVLVSAPGDSRAAVEAVREILRAVRDRVIAGFHEAAVILRNFEEDAPLLEEALRIRSIPAYLQGGTPFARRPLARAVTALAGLEADGFSRPAILHAMELASAALPPKDAALADAAQWRALSNEARFLGGVESWDRAAAALVREARSSLRAAEEAAGGTGTCRDDEEERTVPDVAEAHRRLKASEALALAWRMVRTASAGWPAALSWRRWAAFLGERLQPLLGASEDWELLAQVLDDIGALGAEDGRTVSRQRLAAALDESIGLQQCPRGRFRRNGVNLISVTAARGLRFPLVIIPGLDEGRFPARLSQDPLLLDGERRRIGNPARLPLKSQRGEEERLLFDMAVRSAERRLVLLTSRLDESSGRERIPSEFFLRAAAAARGGHLSLQDLTETNVPGFRSVGLERPAPPAGAVPVDRGEIRLRLVLSAPGREQAALASLAAAEPQLLAGPLAFDRARWSGKLTAFDGRLSEPALRAWVAARFGAAAGPVSAGRIEEYARCPYLFYLRRVMGLRRWEEEETGDGLDPLKRGRCVHEILERFLRAVSPDGLCRDSLEDLWHLLEQTAIEALERFRPPGIVDLVWELEAERLLRLLRNWLAHEKDRSGDGLRPAGFETPFGSLSRAEPRPDYVVQAGRHRFAFRGRIDRVDLGDDGRRARVIDYKTGRLPESMVPSKRTPLMGGERIQIAVYRGALSVLEEFASADTVEGEYLHLQPGDGCVRERPFAHEELLAAQQRLAPLLEIIGDGLEQGIFFPRTSGSVNPIWHCEYCDFLAVCGREQVLREERKAGDEAVVRFAGLAAVDGAPAEEGE